MKKTMTKRLDDKLKIFPKSREEFRSWLEKNWKNTDGVWVVYGKKNNSETLIRYEDVRDECLCFGWVDSLPRAVDDLYTSIYVKHRNPKSVWSALNKSIVAKLIQSNQMHPNGLLQIEIAKKNGLWEIYDNIDVSPADLLEALSHNEKARANFSAFTPGVKRNIHLWLKLTNNAKTRANRITKVVSDAEKNIKTNNPG